MSGPIKPSEQEIREFVAKHRSIGKTLADILGKIAPEVNGVIDTEIGWELIKGDYEHARNLAHKVLSLKATDDEKVECKYLLFERIPRVAKRISDYLHAIALIRNESGTGTNKTT